MGQLRSCIAVAGVIAITAGVCAGPAQAAKVTQTALGGAVPNATGGGQVATSHGLFTQTFNLTGKKVKGKQVLDVNLTMTSFGNTGDVNDDLRAKLVAPDGANTEVPLPDLGASFLNLKFDDQSDLTYCDPFDLVASDCLYAIGSTLDSDIFASFTGTVGTSFFGSFGPIVGFNPVFRGSNPKGKWTLKVWDLIVGPAAAPQTALLGTSKLEVTTSEKPVEE